MTKGRINCCWMGVGVVVLLSSCQSRTLRPDALVVVKDIRISDNRPPIARFARHNMIEYRADKNAPWRRVEIPTPTSGIVDVELTPKQHAKRTRWGRKMRIIAQYTAEDGSDFAEQIQSFVAKYEDDLYNPWPGPNSNSFIEGILRETNGLDAVLDHNSVGKDCGWYLGPTAGGTGLEFQATFFGAAIGVREGVEVNLLGFTAGVGIWPPMIKIPVLPEISARW